MGDVFDIVFRSVLVEFLGASARWSYHALWDNLKGKKAKSFSEVWRGSKKASHIDQMKYGMSNIFLGYLVIVFLIVIGFVINSIFY